MKKKPSLKLTTILSICLFFCGCQRGPTDQQLIKTAMNNWKQAVIAQDVNAILISYSEDFSSQEAEDKEGVREFWQEAIEQGMLENIDINLETAGLEITDDTAEFTIFGDNGEKEIELALKKEDEKTWRIIGDLSDSCSYESYTSAYGDDCVRHAGYYRCWDIYVPTGLTGSTPLVIDLHGWTESPSRQRAISGFDSLADSEGFIIVWPYGLCNSWNSGSCCGSAVEENIDDVGFIRKLVARVSAQHSIDSGRIYVTGLSNGCSMTQRLANEASDMIAAAACMSLHLLVPQDSGYAPVSVMTLLGTNDDLYYPGDDHPGALGNFEKWKAMNNCAGTYTETWRSGNSYAWTYQTCDNDTEISLVTIDEGGHVLYKGEETDIDTARIAWDFMKRFTK